MSTSPLVALLNVSSSEGLFLVFVVNYSALMQTPNHPTTQTIVVGSSEILIEFLKERLVGGCAPLSMRCYCKKKNKNKMETNRHHTVS